MRADTPDFDLNLCIFAHSSMCAEDAYFDRGELRFLLILRDLIFLHVGACTDSDPSWLSSGNTIWSSQV